MKSIIAIVQSDDAGTLTDALREKDFQSTLISSTGGFLREGNATLLIGVEDAQVEAALRVIKENCNTRTQFVNPMPPVMEMSGSWEAKAPDWKRVGEMLTAAHRGEPP